MSDYHNLVIWKEGMVFVKSVYEITKQFPASEQYSLVRQLQRAAISVVANIVEGNVGRSNKDFLRYLRVSSGSLSECRCLLEIAEMLGYMSHEEFQNIERKIQRVGYLLYRLIASLE